MNYQEINLMHKLHGGKGDDKTARIPNGTKKYEAVFVRQVGKPDGHDWSGVSIERGFCTYELTSVIDTLEKDARSKLLNDIRVFRELRGVNHERAMGCFVVDYDGARYQASQFIWLHSDKCCGACQWDTTSGA